MFDPQTTELYLYQLAMMYEAFARLAGGFIGAQFHQMAENIFGWLRALGWVV